MAKPDCIDFRERFGKRFRLRKEADGLTWFQTPPDERKWLLEIPCKHGVVYPYGGEVLAAVAIGRTRVKVRRLPFLLSRRGDQELVVTFHVDHVDEVLDLLKPAKKRQVSEIERARLRDISRKYRLSLTEKPQGEQGATQTGEGIPRPQPEDPVASLSLETASCQMDVEDVGEGEPHA